MAKIAQLFLAAIVLNVLVGVFAADDPFKCYTCSNCEEYKESQLADCTSKVCYIKGDPETEKWERGCATSKDAACKNVDSKHECTTCEESECNSGSFVTGSIAMTLGVAALIKMMH